MDLRHLTEKCSSASLAMEDCAKILLSQHPSTPRISMRMTIIDGYYTSYVGMSESALFVGAWDGTLRVLSFIVL